MENNRILLIGGGGHCKSVLDCLLSNNKYDEIGIIEKDNTCNESILGISVVGTDNDLPKLFNDGWENAFITLGSVGNTKARRNIYNNLKTIGFNLPMIKDKSSIIARDVEIDEGTFIGKKVVINAGTTIGKCAIINTAAVIEHNCKIGEFVHVSPSATLCGNVTIEKDTHIGAKSIVKQGLTIGENTIIGIGSVVTKNIDSNVKAYGNPCKVVKNI